MGEYLSHSCVTRRPPSFRKDLPSLPPGSPATFFGGVGVDVGTVNSSMVPASENARGGLVSGAGRHIDTRAETVKCFAVLLRPRVFASLHLLVAANSQNRSSAGQILRGIENTRDGAEKSTPEGFST